jgi:hypothetical protein
VADIDDVRLKVRRALGDLGNRFRVTLTGGTDEYELGYSRVADLAVEQVLASVVTPIPPTDYVLNATDGVITFDVATNGAASILVTGHYYSLFEDFELDAYIDTAVERHTYERDVTTRSRDGNGFIRYTHTPMTLADLPVVEEEALSVMATIEALWDMVTDAASDVDVWTAEGTHLARGQRFEQLMELLESLQERYNSMAEALNIGLNRVEVSTLRRFSRETGRLVPVFVEREYDESGVDSYPVRILPPIDSRDEDESGLPSPIWGPGY